MKRNLTLAVMKAAYKATNKPPSKKERVEMLLRDLNITLPRLCIIASKHSKKLNITTKEYLDYLDTN